MGRPHNQATAGQEPNSQTHMNKEAKEFPPQLAEESSGMPSALPPSFSPLWVQVPGQWLLHNPACLPAITKQGKQLPQGTCSPNRPG